MADINYSEIKKLPTDFEEITDLLVNRIKTRLPNRWTDFLTSNFGMELLEAFSYEATLFYYYLNNSVNECFMPTAKTENAVYNLARTIGYKPNSPKQSTVTVKFTIPIAIISNISIPKYTKLSNNENVPFYTSENKIMYTGETYVEVEAKSGSLHTETFISTGIPRYRYKLTNYPVNNIESILIDEEEYTYSDFIDIESTEKLYTIDYDDDYVAYISFGNGLYGVNPAKNSIIEIIYVSNADASHNVNAFTITNIIDSIYDSSNALVTNISVINNDSAVGAANKESVNEIKINAPSIYRTQKRCVTRQDFKDTVLAMPNVEKVSVIDNSLMDEIGIFGVKICAIPKNSRIATDSFKDYIKEYLENRKIVSTQIDVIDPSFIPFNVDISVNIQKTLSSSLVSNRIRRVVTDYLNYNNRDFGQEVSKQELYTLISNINGVISINNITIEEQRTVYVSETPTVGTSILKYIDNINCVKIGANINIMNLENESALITTIIDIDEDLSEITIDDTITYDMNIGYGSLIYPILETDGEHLYGSKEVAFVIDIEEGIYQINYPLINFSNTSIYFEDNPNKIYKILFKIGNILYLNEPIDRTIAANTNIIILYKKNIPTLFANVPKYSNVFYLTDYPRFGEGSALTKQSMITFASDTLTLIRKNDTKDYLSTAIDIDYLAQIEQIYTNAQNVFIPGIDYNLLENGKIIEWTVTGRSKLTVNSKYYVDIIKKVINTSDTDVVYYVKSIDKKTIIVTPSTPTKLLSNTIFDYTTDKFILMPNEIADVGSINVTTI